MSGARELGTLERALHGLLALWALFAATFFVLRMSFVFYEANEASIRALLGS